MTIRSKLLWIILCLALIGALLQAAVPVSAQGGGPEPITAANAHRLKLLTTWGRGTIYDLAWSPDRKTLAAGTAAGLWLFSAALPRTAPRQLATDAVDCLAFSADGKVLAVGTGQGVQLWDTAQWQPSGERFGGAFNGIALSPDGKMLAAGSGEDVELWDITSRQIVARPDSKGSGAVAFSPDGTRLAYGWNPIQLWDIQKQAQVMELADKTGAFRYAGSIAFSPDGTRLAASSDDRIGLWDTRTGQQVDLLSPSPYGKAPRIEYDRKGTLLLTLVTSDFLNETIQLRNVLSSTSLVTFQVGPNELFGDLSFSPDGTALASVRNILGAGVTAWWNVKTGAPVYQQVTQGGADMFWLSKGNSALFVIHYPDDYVSQVKGKQAQTIISFRKADMSLIDPVHLRLALSYRDGPVRVLDAQTGNKLFGVPMTEPRDLIFTPSGKYLIVGKTDDQHIWQAMIVDAETGKQQAVTTVPGVSYGVRLAAFDLAEKLLAVINDGDNVLLIDMQTGKTLQTLANPGESLRFNAGGLLMFNGDGSRVVLGSLGLVRMWDIQTGKLIAELSRPREGMYIEGDAEFGLNDKRVAFMDEDIVRLYDAETGRQLAELVVSNGYPRARFSPDGARLVVIYGNVIQVWDAETGNRLFEWNTPDQVDRWVFSPDGSILITATITGILQLWVPTTGQQLVELKGHHARLWSIVFSPDRSLLATSSDDDTVRLWGLDKP